MKDLNFKILVDQSKNLTPNSEFYHGTYIQENYCSGTVGSPVIHFREIYGMFGRERIEAIKSCVKPGIRCGIDYSERAMLLSTAVYVNASHGIDLSDMSHFLTERDMRRLNEEQNSHSFMGQVTPDGRICEFHCDGIRSIYNVCLNRDIMRDLRITGQVMTWVDALTKAGFDEKALLIGEELSAEAKRIDKIINEN